MQQGLHAWLGEAQSRSALAVDLTRPLQVLKRIFAKRTVVTDLLDFEQVPIGLEADAAQLGKIAQVPANAKVARIVDDGLGAKRLALLVVLLDPRALVVDM